MKKFVSVLMALTMFVVLRHPALGAETVLVNAQGQNITSAPFQMSGCSRVAVSFVSAAGSSAVLSLYQSTASATGAYQLAFQVTDVGATPRIFVTQGAATGWIKADVSGWSSGIITITASCILK